MSTQPVPELPVLYTVDEVAELLRLDSPSHIDRHCADWPHVVIARKRMFRPEDIAEIVRRHARTGNELPEGAGTSPVAPAVAGRATRSGRSGP